MCKSLIMHISPIHVYVYSKTNTLDQTYHTNTKERHVEKGRRFTNLERDDQGCEISSNEQR